MHSSAKAAVVPVEPQHPNQWTMNSNNKNLTHRAQLSFLGCAVFGPRKLQTNAHSFASLFCVVAWQASILLLARASRITTIHGFLLAVLLSAMPLCSLSPFDWWGCALTDWLFCCCGEGWAHTNRGCAFPSWFLVVFHPLALKVGFVVAAAAAAYCCWGGAEEHQQREQQMAAFTHALISLSSTSALAALLREQVLLVVPVLSAAACHLCLCTFIFFSFTEWNPKIKKC